MTPKERVALTHEIGGYRGFDLEFVNRLATYILELEAERDALQGQLAEALNERALGYEAAAQWRGDLAATKIQLAEVQANRVKDRQAFDQQLAEARAELIRSRSQYYDELARVRQHADTDHQHAILLLDEARAQITTLTSQRDEFVRRWVNRPDASALIAAVDHDEMAFSTFDPNDYPITGAILQAARSYVAAFRAQTETP